MKQTSKTKKREKARGGLVLVACGLLGAAFVTKTVGDYTLGIDSPFAKVCYHLILSDNMKTNYQSDLAKNRKGVIERGGPNKLARILSFPYSLKYPEYRTNK